MSKLHDHLIGKVKEEERIKQLKKRRQEEAELFASMEDNYSAPRFY